MLFTTFLSEKSSIVDYYEKHPELIKDIDFTISRKAENVSIFSQIRYLLMNNTIEGNSYNKLKNTSKKYFEDTRNDLDAILDHLKGENLYPKWSTLSNPRVYEIEQLIEILKNNKKDIPPFLKKYLNMLNAVENYEVLWLTKFAKERGVSYSFLFKSLQEIFRYRSMSGQKISSEALDAIKILTVKSKPGKIYRGWFLDGDKLNKIKGIENLKEGDSFTFNFGKATSWSTVKDIAASFTYPQDMIKNSQDGYSMIISYEPNIEEVVADFRDVKLSDVTKFYNQQEIMLESGKKTFKIESIKKSDHISASKVNGNGGASSGSYNDLIKGIIISETMKKIDDDSIMKLAEEMSKMTVGEVFKKYPNHVPNNYIPSYIEENKNINYRLFLIMNYKWSSQVKGLRFNDDEVTVYISNKFSFEYNLDKLGYIKIKISNNYNKLFTKLTYTHLYYKTFGEFTKDEMIEIVSKWFK